MAEERTTFTSTEAKLCKVCPEGGAGGNVSVLFSITHFIKLSLDKQDSSLAVAHANISMSKC